MDSMENNASIVYINLLIPTYTNFSQSFRESVLVTLVKKYMNKMLQLCHKCDISKLSWDQ